MENKTRKKDIAIVGVSGKYPKSDTINEFWEHLKNGEELVHFYTDDELRAVGVSEKDLANPSLIKAQASLDDPNSFDYSFFGYTKQEAISMDPQIRMMHEQVWLGLEDAGYNPRTYKDKIGLYLSASDNMNWRAYTMIANNDNVNSFFLNQISNKNFISTLISYNLNLRGPSYYVDTACSSSLVAVHQACRSLLMRECSIAIAGGIRIYSKPYRGHSYQEGMTNSKDGHCKAFDEDSSGIVSGEGAGVVILKRLEDAIADNDQIYAVIRSSVVNNDGNRKVGYTAPSINGQYECIKQAHQIAEVSPESITYIEAHGTGTKLGDPIEVEALNKSFGYNANHHCALGSVKTNIGHLDAAAGITGFLKATLSLKNKMIPPSLHFKNPNPEINFKSGPFKVQTELATWNSVNNQPLRAGVSSFGIGGNNAHVILEEAPEKAETIADNSYQLLRFSAQSVGSLNAYQEKLISALENKENDSFRDMAYTLQTGRNQFKYNRFLVSNSKENALEILKDPLSTALYSAKLDQKRKIVFMCTGSGAQYLNMGKDLYENEPYFKQLMDEGFSIIKELTGVDVQKVLYKEATATGGFDVNKNEFTQPIVFVFEYALAKQLIRWGIQPDKLIGHSTGEFVAACLSGVFSFETGLRLVAKRALLMNKSSEGSMLSVSLSEEKVKKYLNSNIALAVVNSPESCVLSGTVDAIETLIEIFEAEEILCSKLKISLGGHSFLMDPVLEEFREELKKVEFSTLKIPFVSNLTGALITSEEAMSSQYWIDHLRSTVRFSDGLTTLLKEPNTIFIEVGPGNTLTTLFQQQKHDPTSNNTAVNLIRHPKQEINDQEHLLKKIGELWTNGIDIDWEAYYGAQKPYKVAMPGYAFNKTKLPVKVNPFEFINFSGAETSAAATIPFALEHFDDNEAFQEDPEENAISFINYVAPTNETEKKLVEMWQTFFSKEEIGILHDFFALGGNSLKGVTMLKLIQKVFDIDIKIKDFYQKSTIKELASEIDMRLKFVTKLEEESSYKSVMTI